MSERIQSDYQRLATDAVRTAAACMREFMNELGDDQVELLERHLANGARLVLQIEPAATPPQIEFLLVAKGGSTFSLAHVAVRAAAPH